MSKGVPGRFSIVVDSEREALNAFIAAHLSRMLGGTISTVTAFVATNFQFSPAFVLWLAPPVVFVPLIVYWNRAILQPPRPAAVP